MNDEAPQMTHVFHGQLPGRATGSPCRVTRRGLQQSEIAFEDGRRYIVPSATVRLRKGSARESGKKATPLQNQ